MRIKLSFKVSTDIQSIIILNQARGRYIRENNAYFRSKGRVSKALVYGTQPVIAELDL